MLPNTAAIQPLMHHPGWQTILRPAPAGWKHAAAAFSTDRITTPLPGCNQPRQLVNDVTSLTIEHAIMIA